MSELKNRGVRDVLPAAVDGLTGFPEAITAVFSKTEVQLRVVHMIRNSTRFVPYKDRKAVVAGLKTIYPALPAELAAAGLDGFDAVRGRKYPMTAKRFKKSLNIVSHFRMTRPP
jgi:transposase-like protein